MKYIFIIYFSILLFSCNTEKRKIELLIIQWSEKEIKFPNTINIKQDSLWKSLTSKEFKILFRFLKKKERSRSTSDWDKTKSKLFVLLGETVEILIFKLIEIK